MKEGKAHLQLKTVEGEKSLDVYNPTKNMGSKQIIMK